MSALTKIFVLLNVVLSLLLASAAIVYVNTQGTTSTQLNNALTANKELTTKNSQLEAAMAAATADKLSMAAAKDEQNNQLRAELAAKEQLLAQSEEHNAELTANNALANTANSSTGEALKMAQGVIAERTTSYDKLRGEYDAQQKNLAETSLALDNQINRADVTRKQLLVANEQIAQLNQNLTKLNDTVRKYNIPVTDAGQNTINTDPGVDVTAKIQEVSTIGGVRYATINVGSADSVAKNMQFNVVDPKKGWLGYIVLDTVNVHDSYGRLSGPNIGQVQQGAIVRSQLK